MASILVFKEEPRRTFRLQLSVALQPPENVSIVYDLPAGSVTFDPAAAPPSFTVSPDGKTMAGGEVLTSMQPTFSHVFDLLTIGDDGLISVKASVTWPATKDFHTRFTRVLP